jgi:hypothetical protein
MRFCDSQGSVLGNIKKSMLLHKFAEIQEFISESS